MKNVERESRSESPIGVTNSSPPPSDYNAAGSYHQGQAAAAAAAAAALAAELSSLHSLAAQGAAGAGLSRL